MSDERWPEIEASLRRQFEPPSLAALEQQIADAAEAAEAEASGTHVVPLPATRPSSASWRRSVGLAMAVAAAVVLVWWLGSGAPPSTTPEDSLLDAPKIAMASRLAAGEQLDAFLNAARALPPMDADCATEAPPSCEGTEQQPQLQPDLEVRLLGECGGVTGFACADHDLPAQRAMLVQLEPSGAEAIICIEPPWADPKPVLPDGSDYNIFRRQVGTYVLYEVTPLSAPQALSHFSIPG